MNYHNFSTPNFL